MPATVTYGWTTPVSSAANDVPADLSSLAQQVEATVKAKSDRTAYAEAAGSFSAGQRTGTSYTEAITFPVGRFSVAPIVTAQLYNTAAGFNTLQVAVDSASVTTTGCNIVFSAAAGGTFTNLWCTASWHAKQMTSTTAAG